MESDAVAIVGDVFGHGGDISASELPAEYDRNFLIQEAGLPLFVLKISRAMQPESVLKAEVAAGRLLSDSGLPYRFPLARNDRAGRSVAYVKAADGRDHPVRLLEYVRGVPLANVVPHTPGLLRGVGQCLGRVDGVLARLELPGLRQDLPWNLQQGRSVVEAGLSHMPDRADRELVEGFLRLYDQHGAPVADRLRRGIIHGDANDYNVLIQEPVVVSEPLATRAVAGLVDFGDMSESYTVAEPAIACAYAMMGKRDPVGAAAELVGGYHQEYPLDEVELQALFPLICLRLCVSVALAAVRRAVDPQNDYLQISAAPAWALLRHLRCEYPDLAHFRFRHQCGLESCPGARRVEQWLEEQGEAPGPVVDVEMVAGNVEILDLSIGSLELEGEEAPPGSPVWRRWVAGRLSGSGRAVGLGRYGEVRRWYRGDLFRSPGDGAPEWRAVNLGIDLFLEPGTPVLAALEGRVCHARADCRTGGEGGVLLLEHCVTDSSGERIRFHTLYGQMEPDDVTRWSVGDPVSKGEELGRVGHPRTSGGWPPHLRLQLIGDPAGCSREFPRSAPPGQRAVWLSICPNPRAILGIGKELWPETDAGHVSSVEDRLRSRRRLLGPNLSLSYRRPLEIVRGDMQYMYDRDGRRFLDGVNNVAHVGHSHPRVVEAIRRQAAVLNTNTRYLHQQIIRLAERLTALLPGDLSVCYFTCSGSEANELALRLARAHTGQHDVMVVDGAYHGNTTALTDISPYKHDGPGGRGAPPHVWKTLTPDGYRGAYRGHDRSTGLRYAVGVGDTIKVMQAEGRGLAAFFCESVLSCAGQIILPPGYLEEASRLVRQSGGVCVYDEVQVGFGRAGSHFWGFETQGVVPDIVTMGKPMGNGHPLAAVVTTPRIAASFHTGMEYFNTFGGNPVSCAAGLAVLDVMEDESLQERAREVGEGLLSRLRELAGRHPLIGDVRGLGLFIGVELVLDRDELIPATQLAAYVVERMKDLGILLSTDGPFSNVLKIKPPLVFSSADAELLVDTLDRVLAEDLPSAVVRA